MHHILRTQISMIYVSYVYKYIGLTHRTIQIYMVYVSYFTNMYASRILRIQISAHSQYRTRSSITRDVRKGEFDVRKGETYIG